MLILDFGFLVWCNKVREKRKREGSEIGNGSCRLPIAQIFLMVIMLEDRRKRNCQCEFGVRGLKVAGGTNSKIFDRTY
jgi:hypothetical protein